MATRGLRATLYSECGHRTEVHSPSSYQGCFRDGPASRPLLRQPTEGPTFSHRLDLNSCAARCEGYEYFGLRAGGVCRCGAADGTRGIDGGAAEGKSFDVFGSEPDTACDVPCTGDPSRMCGGEAHLSLYRQAGPRPSPNPNPNPNPNP